MKFIATLIATVNAVKDDEVQYGGELDLEFDMPILSIAA